MRKAGGGEGRTGQSGGAVGKRKKASIVGQTSKKKNKQEQHHMISNKYLEVRVSSSGLLQPFYEAGTRLAVSELNREKGYSRKSEKDSTIIEVDCAPDPSLTSGLRSASHCFSLRGQLELQGTTPGSGQPVPLRCSRCEAKLHSGAELVRLNYAGGRFITTPRNFKIKLKASHTTPRGDSLKLLC
jgi:hypothetical protein